MEEVVFPTIQENHLTPSAMRVFTSTLLLVLSCTLLAPGCQLLEVVDDIRTLNFLYRRLSPAPDVAQAAQRATSGDLPYREGTRTFIATGSDIDFNFVRLIGDPATPTSSLEIFRYNPSTSDPDEVTGIRIVIIGPLVAGQTYEADMNVFTGSRGNSSFEYDSGASQTYASLTLEVVDLDDNIVGGSFHALVRQIDQPTQVDPFALMDGAFRLNIDRR